MLLAVAAVAVGVFVGFVFGTIFFTIFNDQKGLSRTALWWLVGLYLGIGEVGGGLAIQVISHEPPLTAWYLICCTLSFLVIGVPTFFDYRASGRLKHVRVHQERLDALILKKKNGDQ